MITKSGIILIFASAFLSTCVEGHGFLKSPRSRSWYANPNSGDHEYGNPLRWDYCYHCLNSKPATSVCAVGEQDYDNWVDNNGIPFPWTTQAVYNEGQEIEVEVVLTANHAGHIDLFVCPMGEDSTVECLLEHPLEFVRNVYDPEGPYDEFYPSRGYVSGKSDHKFIYKLPMGVHGKKVLLQWRYVTANSCIPPGYRRSELNLGADGIGWMRSPGMADCEWPPNQTGERDSVNPEQFWNCADIEIIPASPTKSPAPTAEPVPTPIVTKAPTKAPSPTSQTGGCCTWDGGVTCGTDWCNENKAQCEGNCAGTFIENPTGPTPTYPTYPTPTAPTPTAPTPTAPTPPSQTPGYASTTRYWDCSGGACGCAYSGSNGEPAHCYSNAMFEAPSGNEYGAKYYGTAAVSAALGGGNWLSEACGKCWKVQGWSNVQSSNMDTFQTTLVLKGANYCPPSNPACSGDKKHFDISAPGFDFLGASQSNTCDSVEDEEKEAFRACGRWMIDSPDPNEGCDCTMFKDPVLRAGCHNFYSLLWNNIDVTYEEVDCPDELNRLNCWEENGGGYPDDVPQFCASNLENPFTTSPTTKSPVNSPVASTSSPTSSPVASTSSPTSSPTSVPQTGPCCSWNVPQCGDNEWCNESKDNCEGNCSGTWLDSNSETEAPVPSPTSSGGDYCCSDDLKTCKEGWCNESESNCSSCNAVWMVVDTQCSLGRWENCLGRPDDCCAPSTCHDFGYWAQCLVN